MVAYLAGPETGYVTGASLTIDGDFTAWPTGAGGLGTDEAAEEPLTHPS